LDRTEVIGIAAVVGMCGLQGSDNGAVFVNQLAPALYLTRFKLLPADVLLASLADAISLNTAQGFQSERDGPHVLLPLREGIGAVAQRPVVPRVEADDDAGM
jgi:hypothetical protein